jgi:3-oxoacyl-[acyl-carrier-protein] synthase-3
LTIPAGAFRHQHTEQTACRSEREGGNARSDEDLFMDGAEVFTFALREVPPLVATTLEADGLTTVDVDAFVFHQANQFMLNYLAKRLKLPADRVVMGLRDYGNTSSASIPLALTTELAPRLRNERLRLLMAGFGAGFSWAAALAHCGPMTMPELVVVPGGGAAAQRFLTRAHRNELNPRL